MASNGNCSKPSRRPPEKLLGSLCELAVDWRQSKNGADENHRRHVLHRFDVILISFLAKLMWYTYPMYIRLLARYHCSTGLSVLHFVNFDNFLTFPNRKFLQVKHSSCWTFNELQTHMTQTKMSPAKTFQANANILTNVSSPGHQSSLEKRIVSQTSKVQPLKFENGLVISSHILLSVWLLIRAGIKVNLCQ